MKRLENRHDTEYSKLEGEMTRIDAANGAISELSVQLNDSLSAISDFSEYSTELEEQLKQLGADPCCEAPHPNMYGTFNELVQEAEGGYMMRVWGEALKKSRQEADDFRSLSQEERHAHYIKNWSKIPSSDQ